MPLELLLQHLSSTQAWSHVSFELTPDMQEEALPVNELHGARLALNAACCNVYNVSHSYLLPCGVLHSNAGFPGF